jgi:hypothetical protein
MLALNSIFWVKSFLLFADIYIAARDPILIRANIISILSYTSIEMIGPVQRFFISTLNVKKMICYSWQVSYENRSDI